MTKKEKNSINKMIFENEEVKNHQHDEIIMHIMRNPKSFHKLLLKKIIKRTQHICEKDKKLFTFEKIKQIEEKYYEIYNIRTEVPVCKTWVYNGELKRGNTCGFIDLALTFKSECAPNYSQIMVEVKSFKPKFGDILREINFYKELARGRYFLVCPDCDYEDLLREQDVGYINTGEIMGLNDDV